ncbi:MAG: glycosyltransferase family 2 protein [Eubacterium sp.]
MEPLISVVVPIYKVEDYISRCVDSIINQTYKNLEIILVDDGSPDNCPQLCDEYAKKDNRIKVIHKINGGLSDARNAGMKVSTGEYISFIDSDDYITFDFLETLYNTMITENSDIVECCVVKFYEDNHFDEYNDDFSIENYGIVDGLSALISENPFKQHVWNKLYKTDLVMDISFAVGKLNEDEFWTYQVFGKAERITKINKTMYYYFQRSSSIMGNTYNLKRLDALEGKANRQKYIDIYFPELSLKSKIDLYGSCIFAYQCVLKYMSGKDKKKAKSIINEYRGNYNLTFTEIKNITDSSKKYYLLSKINFYFCCKLKALLNIGF